MDGPVYHLEGVVKAKEAGMEDFVGPLDLILHLLAKNKMEIQDIQLSLILDQYLAWMDRRRELDLEVASEFVAMASHLPSLSGSQKVYHTPHRTARQANFATESGRFRPP